MLVKTFLIISHTTTNVYEVIFDIVIVADINVRYQQCTMQQWVQK